MYLIFTIHDLAVCNHLSPQSSEDSICTRVQSLRYESVGISYVLANQLTEETKYGNPNPAPPHSIALTHKTVISGAPTKDPSVLVNMTILKSCASDPSSATSGDLTNDMVNTGSAEPSA